MPDRPPEPMAVFDRQLLRKRRDRAAERFADHNFLVLEVAERLVDRLDDVARTFPTALDLGCHCGELANVLDGRGGIETLVHCDLSPAMAARAPLPAVVADEEWLPFADGAFDLVLSVLDLHWINDLPGALVQIRRCLRPDGLLLAAMLGGETLKELRHALGSAEIALEGGMSPRVSPFADVRDMGGLLMRAGFALPVVDTEVVTVRYESPMRLMADLHHMGESNLVRERRHRFTRRTTLLEAAARYTREFALSDGRVPATFQVLYLTAWAPDPSQPKPRAPGSGQVPLSRVLGGEAEPGGEGGDNGGDNGGHNGAGR